MSRAGTLARLCWGDSHLQMSACNSPVYQHNVVVLRCRPNFEVQPVTLHLQGAVQSRLLPFTHLSRSLPALVPQQLCMVARRRRAGAEGGAAGAAAQLPAAAGPGDYMFTSSRFWLIMVEAPLVLHSSTLQPLLPSFLQPLAQVTPC